MTDLVAPIKAVTVYADRALITRRGSLQLAAGEHELSIHNLPLLLIRDSLRASGQGPQGTRILNVDVTTAFHSRPPEASLQAQQDALEQLQQQRDLLKARQEALNDRRQWLRALGEQSRDFARGLARGQMKPEDCGDFFSFMSTQALQDAETAQELDLQLRHLQKEIDAGQRELARLQNHKQPDRLTATVTVELAQDGEFELLLSYLISNASWHPQYDVRVEPNEQQNTGNVELTYVGIVQQATGERWEQVELALSTARPSLAATLPELQPWYLHVHTPQPLSAPVAYAAQSMAASPKPQARFSRAMLSHHDGAADETPADEQLSVPAEVATADVEHTGTALVFRASRSADIPSDNSPHKTTIAQDNLPCEFDYVSAPAIEEYAHLRATISNTTTRVLLNGDASIFLSGEYVGTTRVKTTASNEQFKIFLGIDDGIKVKREATERAVDKGNLLQNDLRRSTYAYRITIHNYTAIPRKIVIRDRLPVAQHERLKVKLLNIHPQPTEHTKLELLQWELTLPPDAEQKIEYRFVVEYPQGLTIIGLPDA